MEKEANKKVEDAHAGTGQMAKEQGAKVLSNIVPEVKENRFKAGQGAPQTTQKVEKKLDEGMGSLQKLIAAGEEVKKNIDKFGNVYGSPKRDAAEEKYAKDSKGFETPVFRARNEEDANRDFDSMLMYKMQAEEGKSTPVASFFRRIGNAIQDAFEDLGAKIKILAGEAGDRIKGMLSAQRTNQKAMGWVAAELDPETADRFKKTPPVAVVFERGGRLEDIMFSGDSVAAYVGNTNEIMIKKQLFYQMRNANRLEILCHEQFHYAAYLGGGGLNGIRWRDENGKPQFIDREKVLWLHEGITELLAQNLVHSKGYETTMGGYAVETAAAHLLGQLVGNEVLKNAYVSGDFTKVREIVNEKLGPYSFEFIMDGSSSAERIMRLIMKIKDSKADVGNPLDNWLIKKLRVLDDVWAS